MTLKTQNQTKTTGGTRDLASRRMGEMRRRFIGETVGTYLMVMIGTSSVAAAAITGAQIGLWQVAVVWTLGVSLAIYATANISGAHLNPAVTLAFAIFRRG